VIVLCSEGYTWRAAGLPATEGDAATAYRSSYRLLRKLPALAYYLGE
jgi:hypothetical protein